MLLKTSDTPLGDLPLFQCVDCRRSKPATAFWSTKTSRGVSDRCRDCTMVNARRDREQREERARARAEIEAEKNPERPKRKRRGRRTTDPTSQAEPKPATTSRKPRRKPPTAKSAETSGQTGAVDTRACRCCGKVQPRSELCKRGRTTAGAQRHGTLCRACDAARGRERRAANPERERQQRRTRYWRDPELHRAQARARAATDRAQELNARAVARWKALHQEAVRAHQLVRRAKLAGTIVMPERCSVPRCDRPATHCHHADYREPLRVRAVCPRCHEREHHTLPPEPVAATKWPSTRV